MPNTNPDEAIISLKVPKEAKEALEQMVKVEEMSSVSELVRELLAGYCQNNGFDVSFEVGKWGGSRTAPKELKGQQVAEGDRPAKVRVESDRLYVELADGRIIAAPIAWYPWLGTATPRQRKNVELDALTVFWPDLEEGISIESMLKGPAQPAYR